MNYLYIVNCVCLVGGSFGDFGYFLGCYCGMMWWVFWLGFGCVVDWCVVVGFESCGIGIVVGIVWFFWY